MEQAALPLSHLPFPHLPTIFALKQTSPKIMGNLCSKKTKKYWRLAPEDTATQTKKEKVNAKDPRKRKVLKG